MSQTKLSSMSIELTNKCPLKCPQCYCNSTGDKNIDLQTAKKRIKEGAEHGIKTVNMSGGETMCYPRLFELVSYTSQLCENINIVTSGCFFDENVLSRLIESGMTSISISLNGSTEEINRLTRDGYSQAINAIKIIQKTQFPNSFINWVMHSNNCEDFPNIVKIAEEHGISKIDIIMFKPDSHNELKSFPSGRQMKQISDFCRHYNGPVTIMIETCFSQMLALIRNNSWFGNMDTSENRGCRAGLYYYNVSVNGEYSPCRHIDLYEKYDNLDEYLSHSPIIKRLYEYEEDVRHPCNICAVRPYCRPCPAIPYKTEKDLFKGQECCQVWQFVK